MPHNVGRHPHLLDRMATDGYSLRSALIGTLTHVKRPDVPIMVALRNTAAVIAPLAVGFATGHIVGGLGVSVGALVVMFADQPGPYRQRLEVIALVTVAAALSGLVGFLVGGQIAAAVPILALWGFLGGMLVLFGPGMARVGMTSMILLVVATSTPLPWQQALGTSGLILAGGILQALFSIAAWPLHRYRPERLALAAVYRELARQARRQLDADAAPPVTEQITRLQQTLLGWAQARGRAMEAFHTLLELAERMRLEWMALAEGAAGGSTEAGFREGAAHILEAIADALEKAEPPDTAQRALQALAAREASPAAAQAQPPLHGPVRHMHALTGQMAAAVRNVNWAGSRGEIRARAVDTGMPRALRNNAPLAALRANLNLSSAACRHGLRCAAVLALALVVAHLAGFGHGYWLPMTAAIVLRPDFGATFNVGLLRVLGTLLGLVVTTGLLYLAPESIWAHLALMAVLCFGFRYLAGAHYGIAVAALTGTVVILLSFEGVSPGAAVMERVVNTAIGSAMALGAYMLWPTWERGSARTALAGMLAAYAAYLATVTSHGDALKRRDARTAARAARSRAEASLERLRNEPGTTPDLMQLATALCANGNRLARTTMALEALLDDDGDLPCGDAMDAFHGAAGGILQQLVTAVSDGHPPGALPVLRQLQREFADDLRKAPRSVDDALLTTLSDRLTDNIDTLAHVLDRPIPAASTPSPPHPSP